MFPYILNLVPVIIFGGALVSVFGMFIWGSSVFLFVGEKERGMEIVAKSLLWLFVVILMFLAFSFITYLAKEGGLFNSQQVTGEFPLSPAGSFPPAVKK
ncbi:MAG: hypothetical protein Q8N69_01625 [bacterium]|nr:hypothetical protein [bacterium]